MSDLYGIAEIAKAIGARSGTVAQWHRRGKLPPPDAQLAAGPVWQAKTIRPWIALHIETTLARQETDLDGDDATAASMDAMERAETAGVSPLGLILAGDTTRAAANGSTAAEWRRAVLARHADTSALPPTRLRAVEDELRRAGAWPWR